MKNLEIAKIFYEIADILEMKNVAWKPGAYRKAARALEGLTVDVEEYVAKGLKEVEKIPGVGEGIGKKIIEYCETGKIKEYETLKKKVPKHMDVLMQVPGMGPKKAKVLFSKLKVSTLKQLESAAKKGKIRKLEGFGEKSEEDILRGLELLKLSKGRILLGFALPVAEEIKSRLKVLKEVDNVEIAGSIRRMKETIRDIDVLVTSKKPKKVMDFFCAIPDVKAVLAKGATKSTIVLNSGLQADIRVVDAKSWGAALNYFTGSKDHNIKLRQIAIKKGYKLSEYGLFSRKTGKFIAGKTEKELYSKLGLKYIPPEMRENTGELSLKLIPKLVELKDVKGDLHVHTNWSDGDSTITEMVLEAKKLGYKYICISDHSPSEKIANGLDVKRIKKQNLEIKKINKKINGINVFTGAEVDILKDGSLDYPDEVLNKLDIVVAAIHRGFKNSRNQIMERYEKAMQNKNVRIIGHPTGRLINAREPLNVDIDKLIALAKKYDKVLEINSQPERLDLDWVNVKKAVEAGVKLAVNTDAHSRGELAFVKLGIAVARRGWATKMDIVNTYPLTKLKKIFKKI
ncbi:DNA polymerase/3'-5' exonuclease PolX [Candidatus Woesearchaeota archaeon]|nr:DNA polymerase/3'-5' exonuclease PolX [Candidatus Woesearchaeota archaeon]